jgi:hypothetical protein
MFIDTGQQQQHDQEEKYFHLSMIAYHPHDDTMKITQKNDEDEKQKKKLF